MQRAVDIDPLKVFIGQLSFGATKWLIEQRLTEQGCDGIQDIFVVRKQNDRQLNRRICAFIMFETPEQALRLVQMSGSTWPELADVPVMIGHAKIAPGHAARLHSAGLRAGSAWATAPNASTAASSTLAPTPPSSAPPPHLLAAQRAPQASTAASSTPTAKPPSSAPPPHLLAGAQKAPPTPMASSTPAWRNAAPPPLVPPTPKVGWQASPTPAASTWSKYPSVAVHAPPDAEVPAPPAAEVPAPPVLPGDPDDAPVVYHPRPADELPALKSDWPLPQDARVGIIFIPPHHHHLLSPMHP